MSVPTFAVSQFTTMPRTFAEDLALYARLGLEAIEVCECKLDPARGAQQIREAAARGMRPTSIQAAYHSLFPVPGLGEPADPRERVRLMRGSIERLAPAAPGATFVCITGWPPGGDLRAAYAIAVREYRELARVAADHGVRLALEPLNPLHMNTHTFVCSIPDALRIVDAVDHPALGVWIDVWHVWQDGDVEARIRACGGRIHGVHVNDWHVPRLAEDRAVIGRGEMPLPRLLRALRDAGWRGAYTLELFSDPSLPDSLWKRDPAELIEENRRGFERAWEASCD